MISNNPAECSENEWVLLADRMPWEEMDNEAREKLQDMIDLFHKKYAPWKKPRTYRRIARTEYLALAKSKKRTAKRIRAYIRRDLGRIKRNLGYLEDYMSEGYAMPRKYISQYLTIPELYRRQKYMFDNKTHVVENRIVSINQPFVRPMVRGKAKESLQRMNGRITRIALK